MTEHVQVFDILLFELLLISTKQFEFDLENWDIKPAMSHGVVGEGLEPNSCSPIKGMGTMKNTNLSPAH